MHTFRIIHCFICKFLIISYYLLLYIQISAGPRKCWAIVHVPPSAVKRLLRHTFNVPDDEDGEQGSALTVEGRQLTIPADNNTSDTVGDSERFLKRITEETGIEIDRNHLMDMTGSEHVLPVTVASICSERSQMYLYRAGRLTPAMQDKIEQSRFVMTPLTGHEAYEPRLRFV